LSGIVREVHDRLTSHYGPLGWWPAASPFEVVVGAVLTQNTAWRRVEAALDALRSRDLFDPHLLQALPRPELERLIRPAGTARVKARRLAAVADWLVRRYDGRLGVALDGERWSKRLELLEIHGVGPETADAILLYAGGHPMMVVDAYTRRIFGRHGLLDQSEDYDQIAGWFTDQLPEDAGTLGEMHAQIVSVGKEFCRPRSPACSSCPLEYLFDALGRPRP
jgi:endonuclease-3 related protein